METVFSTDMRDKAVRLFTKLTLYHASYETAITQLAEREFGLILVASGPFVRLI